MTNEQKTATLYCNIALGCVDTLKRQAKPKSAEWNRLDGVEVGLLRCMETYRIESFPLEDVVKATELFDLLDGRIKELYP